MELVKRNEVSFEKSDEETEVDAVGKLSVEIRHLQVQLVQVFVHESH